MASLGSPCRFSWCAPQGGGREKLPPQRVRASKAAAGMMIIPGRSGAVAQPDSEQQAAKHSKRVDGLGGCQRSARESCSEASSHSPLLALLLALQLLEGITRVRARVGEAEAWTYTHAQAQATAQARREEKPHKAASVSVQAAIRLAKACSTMSAPFTFHMARTPHHRTLIRELSRRPIAFASARIRSSNCHRAHVNT